MTRPDMVADAARTPAGAAARLRPELERSFAGQAPSWYEDEMDMILADARAERAWHIAPLYQPA
jgi:hypothetical protein